MRDLGKIADLGLKLAKFEAIFDCAAKFHAALVFLLTAGFDGAVAFFVRLGHFESPKACTGVSRWTLFMTTWRKGDDRKMKADKVPYLQERACLAIF